MSFHRDSKKWSTWKIVDSLDTVISFAIVTIPDRFRKPDQARIWLAFKSGYNNKFNFLLYFFLEGSPFGLERGGMDLSF